MDARRARDETANAMIVFLKYLQYFLIAAGSNMMLATTMPVNLWEWIRFWTGSLIAGLIAMKALQSDAGEPKPKPIDVP